MIINTNYGSVKGVIKISCYDKPYSAFYGIPYAQQPTGNYRFKDARPLEPWPGTLDATKVGDACWNHDRLNPIEKKIIGSDNCLHLNVYMPGGYLTKKRPVMVYIHGGRFTRNSGTPFYFGPDYLMEEDIILVTLNYRLGAFGFLSLNDESLEIPGNAGIKDQLMALKWVKNEIENFGGDANNITLFGESAGGCSVHLHLLHGNSQGLFHRAIIQSGSAFGPWSVRPNGDFAYRLAKVLGYEGNAADDKGIFKVISEADPVRIVEVQDVLLTKEEKFLGNLMTFGPVIEPYVTEKTFIKEHPMKIQSTAWGNNIDVIIGGCSMEGLLFYSTLSAEKISSLGNFSHIVAHNANLSRHSPLSIEKGLKLKEFYYGSQTPSLENADIFMNIQGDKNFWHGMWMAMKAHHKNTTNNSKTFLYRFDVTPESNQTIRKLYAIPHQKGSSHVEDIFYLFKAEYLDAPVKGSRDHKIIEVMTGTFADFARNGNPSSKVLGNVVWENIEGDCVKCVNIEENSRFVEFPESDRMKFWDEICENAI